MAVIHHTTMEPSKLELLTSWLPAQPWYLGAGREPHLTKGGGFRLDDPQGEVGIEFMVVTDESGHRPITYQVPLTYRGTPLDGADHALIGTSEHGVLGRRWIYDGTHDPVLAAQLLALVLGEAEPQAQSTSGAADATVTGHFAESGYRASIRRAEVTDGPRGTDLLVRTVADAGPETGPDRQLTLRVNRILESQPDESSAATEALGYVAAEWLLPDGAKARGLFVVVHDNAPAAA
ncbi:maltokinase N-terminal cap-like domain-containing protein [Peterkaempfera griseoplana]|uniref:maltokinase N-terminal cap-like domain-containing protein n=1 Tax=Peterkaempfera griseoplana TaxID=66896 RepID=UPI0006E1CF22|nr:hypothetical protein [Peterkaempfera griseoplana]